MVASQNSTLSADRFLEKLKLGKPIPGILLLGNESYLREVCRKKLIETFADPNAAEWSVLRFSANEDSVEAVVSQAQTMPMLVPRQVIIYSDAEELENLGEKTRDALLDELEGYLKDPAPFTVLVFEATAFDQRMRPYKILAGHTLVVECELQGEPEEREAAAAMIAEQIAHELKVEIARDATRLLAESTNANLARIRTELEKLASYCGDRKQITLDDVKLLVVSEKRYTVWQLSEMLASGDRARALRFLNSVLHEGEQPVMIVGAVAWMFRKLMEAQELPRGADAWQAARVLRMRRDTAELALREAKRMPREQLAAGLAAVAEADNRLKSGVAAPGAVMEFLVTQLATRIAATSGGRR
jgi:DNA polymerase III subunit delta